MEYREHPACSEIDGTQECRVFADSSEHCRI